MNRTLKPAQAVLLPDYHLSNSIMHCEDARQPRHFPYIGNSTSSAFRPTQVTVTAAVHFSFDFVDTTLGRNRLTTTNYNNHNRTVWPALAGATPADGACLSGTMTVTPAAL